MALRFTIVLALSQTACLGTGIQQNADATSVSDVGTGNDAPLEDQSDANTEPFLTQYGVEVVARFPHDSVAFTQGLAFHQGSLYEGTGLYGESSLRQVDLTSGQVLRQIDLDDRYFGEGIAVIDDRIVQLTWQNEIGFVYDRESFERLDSFHYDTEGWGITRLDDGRLAMSDGTATIHFLDSSTFAEIDTIEVNDERGPVRRLNELEAIEGAIWANVWQTDTIVIIDPASGAVIGRIDLSGLLDPEDVSGNPDDVLNGIAFDAVADRIFVTGKRWRWLFEVELVPET